LWVTFDRVCGHHLPFDVRFAPKFFVRLSRKSARAFADDFVRRWTSLCDAYAPSPTSGCTPEAMYSIAYADGRVWAIDFEFASRIRGHPALFAGTGEYVLEHQDVVSGRASERQDLYALGTALHRVFAGLSDEEAMTMAALPPLPPEVPAHISQLVASLRHEIPRRRLTAAFARGVFG
jgi:hypothetical protein